MIDWDSIKRKLEGTTSDEDETRIQQWLQADDVNKELLKELTDRWVAETSDHEGFNGHGFNSSVAYKRFQKRIEKEVKTGVNIPISTRKKEITLPIRKILAVAASIALVVTFGWYLANDQSHVEEVAMLQKSTARGQKATITLADGSSVRLNSESSITFPAQFSGDFREIELTGEAFFEVQRNPQKPFVVKSGNIITRVLGTSFNVHAFPGEDIAVTVATGKVSVTLSSYESGLGDPTEKQVMLEPGQQAQYSISRQSLSTRDINIDTFLAWKEGIIILDRVTIEEASTILARWYNATFEFENEHIKSCVFNGEFRNDRLVNILENIQFLLDVDYEIMPDNRVILTGDGCQ